jgi:hypothetical protein
MTTVLSVIDMGAHQVRLREAVRPTPAQTA